MNAKTEVPNARRHEIIVFYLLLAMGLYAAKRMTDVLFRPEPNPATVIYSPHSAYLWRVTWSLFAAAFGAFAWSLLGIRLQKISQKIVYGMFATVLVLGIVQTLWFP